jgi:hypothetical protein
VVESDGMPDGPAQRMSDLEPTVPTPSLATAAGTTLTSAAVPTSRILHRTQLANSVQLAYPGSTLASYARLELEASTCGPYCANDPPQREGLSVRGSLREGGREPPPVHAYHGLWCMATCADTERERAGSTGPPGPLGPRGGGLDVTALCYS